MSTPLKSTAGTSWETRSREDATSLLEAKRSSYYLRLASESSRSSEEDTESVCSIQGKETDIARDTSDTESKSEGDYDFEIEFEVASPTESEEYSNNSSSGSESAHHEAILAVAAAALASNIDERITDCEESDNSSVNETAFDGRDFATCLLCKGKNNNPLYRYCDKCFQSRKKFFPPRPKKYKRSRVKKKTSVALPAVRLDASQTCLSGLSQDSGISLSQECPPLNFDGIAVPKRLREGPVQSCLSGGVSENDATINDGKGLLSPSSTKVTDKRKRQISESSLSDFEIKKPKRDEKVTERTNSTALAESVISNLKKIKSDEMACSSNSDILNSYIFDSSKIMMAAKSEQSKLCIICNNAEKDCVFLHTNMAHMCCCYACAKTTLNTSKSCPICNRSVSKVVKIYGY